MKLRNYNQESGDYEFFVPLLPILGENPLDDERNTFISIGFNAGHPNIDKTPYKINKDFPNDPPAEQFTHGVSEAYVTFRGNHDYAYWKATFDSFVKAIATRCKSSLFVKKNSGAKRSVNKVMAIDKERGILYFSLPCVEDYSAGIEIILSMPQGFELFVAGEKKLSCVPSNPKCTSQNDGLIQFKSWNEKSGWHCCTEILLSEFLQKFVGPKQTTANILHNQILIDEVKYNPKSSMGMWFRSDYTLKTDFTFIFGGKDTNTKYVLPSNLLFCWFAHRANGEGYEKRKLHGNA